MAETIAIVDYGSGNLRSAEKALARAATDSGLTVRITVTGDADTVARADRIVLPGVGAFGDCRRGLDAVPGMVDAIEDTAHRKGRPFLGICVGMQLMAREGREHGTHPGFGWLAGHVDAIDPASAGGQSPLKVPHMGWNALTLTDTGRAHPVAGVLDHGDHVYFVHSYHMVTEEDGALLATTDYGGPVTALVGRDTFIGTQFHPEKSQKAGQALLAAFLKWRP